MKGKNITIGGIIIYIISLVLTSGVGLRLLYWFYHRSYSNGVLENNEVILLGLILVFFSFALYKMINEIMRCYSDYLDYCDMEDIKNNELEKKNEKNFTDEVWNNINRRAEKAKIVSLNSVQLGDIKDSIEKIVSQSLGIRK